MKEVEIFKIDISSNIKEEIIKQRLENYRYREKRGWQSKGLINQPFAWLNAAFDQILNIIGKEYVLDRWWMNVNTDGEYTDWHQHHTWEKVAVLYINCPINCGNIEFRKKEEYFSISPNNGDLIVFPGNLEHRVQKNNSQDYRVSVAFNFKKTKVKN